MRCSLRIDGAESVSNANNDSPEAKDKIRSRGYLLQWYGVDRPKLAESKWLAVSHRHGEELRPEEVHMLLSHRRVLEPHRRVGVEWAEADMSQGAGRLLVCMAWRDLLARALKLCDACGAM